MKRENVIKIEEGEKVLISIPTAKDPSGLPRAFRGLEDVDVIEAEVVGRRIGDKSIRVKWKNWNQFVHDDAIMGFGQVCEKPGHQDRIYHDKKEKWICPFCNHD